MVFRLLQHLVQEEVWGAVAAANSKSRRWRWRSRACLVCGGLVRDNTQPSCPLPLPEHRYAVPHLRLPLTWCPLTALSHKLVPVRGWWAFGCKGQPLNWDLTSSQDLHNLRAIRSACTLPDQGPPPPRMPSWFLKSGTILCTKVAWKRCTRRWLTCLRCSSKP